MSSSSTDRLVEVVLPAMGTSVVEGTVSAWLKQAGDWVERDEPLASISTDKIDTDVEAPATGRISEILVPVGETVEVGAVLARIATDARPGEPHVSEGEGGAAQAVDAEPPAARPDARPAAVPGAGEDGATSIPARGADGAASFDPSVDQGVGGQRAATPREGAARLSPVVQRIAAEHGLDLSGVHGTGRDGRIRKQDVLAAVAARDGSGRVDPPLHTESPYVPEPDQTPREVGQPPLGVPQPLSRMRRAIARSMVDSLRTTAQCTTVVEVDMSRIELARARLGVTYLPFVSRATVEALRRFPSLNATLEGDVLTRHEQVHLGIAVSLAEEGLIVPVIRDAQNLNVEGLATRIKDAARRARAGQLRPEELEGATFTITNPGAFGALLATPIINRPQVAILDSEAVEKRPVVITDEMGNDAIGIRPMAYFCMSWDHRALDGAIAAQFLTAVRQGLEDWPLE